jgi:hypothetical protein
MQKKIKISMASVAALMLVILAVNLAMGATSAVSSLAPEINSMDTIEKTNVDGSIAISLEEAENKEQLRELAPATFEEAERDIYPIRCRFLMWTNDGLHIMWGFYGNGRFVGTDSLGKRCWGIYGKGVFAGFYDGDFFWGKYLNGLWKAEYLFGLANSQGKYVLFPPPTITSDNTAVP